MPRLPLQSPRDRSFDPSAGSSVVGAAAGRGGGQGGIQLIAVVALLVCVGYLGWRAVWTVSLSVWWVSVPLLLLEVHALVTFGLFVFTAWDVSALPSVAPVNDPPGRVAVLVATYNEPFEVLLPTVSAAAAMRLEHETWVLDDGHREWVAELAAEVGAGYLTREDRSFAKAGNINAALDKLDAEYVVILDADHVAAPDFLRHTLGYFADPRVALVQTPQDFYNDDSFEHAGPTRSAGRRADAKARDRAYCEQGLFYRVLQPARNRWNAAFCCGSNVVLRASALREVGGFATESITEDIQTSLRLHRRGWRTVYHNEVLARGLAAADAAQYLSQRLRWGTGAMQVLRQDRPLTGGGLTVPQRLSYAATLTGWFDAWRTLGYLLLPMAVLLTGASPVSARFGTFALAFIPAFLAQQLAISRLSRGRGSFGRSMLFEFVRMPANLAATLTWFGPVESEFRVTAKGRQGGRRRRMSVPRLHAALLLLGVASGLWFALSITGVTPLHYGTRWAAEGAAAWLVVNMVVLVAAIRRIRSPRHASERRAAFRFTVAAAASIDGQAVQLQDVSLTGARIIGPPATAAGDFGQLRLILGNEEAPITFDTILVGSTPARAAAGVQLTLEFLPGQLTEQATLARQLFLRLSAPDPGIVGELLAPSTGPAVPDFAGSQLAAIS